MSEAKIWYIVVDGKADGPHTESQLQEWLRAGKLHFSSLVFKPGLSKWVTVSECKEFERREPTRESTAAKMDVPQAAPARGWTILVKHSTVEGKHHYIQSGPFSTEQVREKLKKGELKYEDHIWQQGMKSWAPLASVPEFDRRQEAPAAAAAQPFSSPAPKSVAMESSPSPAPSPSTGAPKPAHAAATPAPSEGESFSLTLPLNQDSPAQEVAQPRQSPAPKPQASAGTGAASKPMAAPQPSASSTAHERPNFAQVKPPPEVAPANKWASSGAEFTTTDAPTRIEPPRAEIPKAAPPKLKNMEQKVAAGVPPAASQVQASHGQMPLSSQRAYPAGEHEPARATREEAAKVKSGPRDLSKDQKKRIPEKEAREENREFIEEVTSGDISMVTSNSILRSYKRRRWLIGGAGIALGVALAYAGMSAYHEVVKNPKNLIPQRQVATARPQFNYAAPALPPPPAMAPQRMANPTPRARTTRPRVLTDPNETLPDPFGAEGQEQVPVNPEVENPGGKTPAVLRIVSLKAESDRPQLALETDLPGGSLIHVEIMARAGSILRYPSFFLEKEVPVVAGTMPSLDLSDDALPPGDYRVVARSGALAATAFLPVGIHDADFRRALAEFHKKVTKTEQNESMKLKSGLKFVTHNYASLSSAYRKTRSNSVESKRAWTSLIRNWRRDYEKEVHGLPRVSERNRNNYAYPEQLMQLRAAENKLSEVVRFYDRSVRAGRSVASEQNDPTEEFRTMVKDLRHSMSGI